mgnify:CR=1 FL=1
MSLTTVATAIGYVVLAIAAWWAVAAFFTVIWVAIWRGVGTWR